MPLYNYQCNDCLVSAEQLKGESLLEEEARECLFEAKHSMNPTDGELLEATRCPTCSGTNTTKTYDGIVLHSYTRGYGYLDKAGCHRDMNLYKLQNEDPYGHMRVTGETDDLAGRLRRAGKQQSKPLIMPVTDAKAAKPTG